MDTLSKSIRRYAGELARTLGWSEEEHFLRHQANAKRAARAKCLELLGKQLVLEDVSAVTVIREGKRVYIGKCRPRLREAYVFDALLPFDGILIDYSPRDLAEIQFKRDWCNDHGLQYFAPSELGDLGVKLHTSRGLR